MARYTLRSLNVVSSIDGKTFDKVGPAIECGKRAGFEFAIDREGVGTVCSWSPIGGLKVYEGV